MPIYEYYCADCQTRFETLRPMSKADDSIQCKSCESMRTSRVLSLFAVNTGLSSRASESIPNAGLGGGCCSGGVCGCSH